LGNQTSDTIVINGQRYNASSGSSVASKSSHAYHQSRPKPSVDGFRPVVQPVVARPQNVRPSHTPAQHVTAHKPIPSKTLMRTAVRKPQIQSPAQLKAQTRTDILARTPQQTISPKVSYNSIDASRLKKATQMIQNPAVSRYGDIRPSSQPNTAPYQPLAQPSQQQPKLAGNDMQLASLAATLQRHAAPKTDMFEQAIASSTSHEEIYQGKASRKGLRNAFIVSGIASFLFLVGAVAYFNVPQISMHLAAAHAGFSAKLPSYSPLGYAFGNLSYGPGNVTVSYKADAAHKFDITQRESSWDSEALLNNFVASSNKSYQTYERAGRTIYFFGSNTATWVDNGIWYTVNGNNSLTRNQLLDLASSM
jgi:hypothetical protein